MNNGEKQLEKFHPHLMCTSGASTAPGSAWPGLARQPFIFTEQTAGVRPGIVQRPGTGEERRAENKEGSPLFMFLVIRNI